MNDRLDPAIAPDPRFKSLTYEPGPGEPMLLWCPECGERHIDGIARNGTDWSKKPHRVHACQHCGHVWQPALMNTIGVRFLPGYKND